MDISYTQEEGTVTVTITGNIDTSGGDKLSNTLNEIMGLDTVERVYFNMTAVLTTTSSGIGKLLRFYKYIDSQNAAMEIKGISSNLYTQFKEIHLDRIFPISKE